TPIGVGGLTNVDRAFKTARVWAVLGDKSFGARGHGTRATSMLVTLGFSELGLHAINTWIVEHNPSRGIVRRLNFTPIGRQRQCRVEVALGDIEMDNFRSIARIADFVAARLRVQETA